MPLHDWSGVEAGIFHAFHTTWIAEIQNALNAGLLPNNYYALAEQVAGGYISDVLALHIPPSYDDLNSGRAVSSVMPIDSIGGTALAEAPPQVRIKESIDPKMEQQVRQRLVMIRHVSTHRVVAMIEIVSPANKDRQLSVMDFVAKTISAIHHGIHILVVDLFKAGKHDPYGIHELIRRRVIPNYFDDRYEPSYEAPQSTLVSYASGRTIEIYLEHLNRLDRLPPMPIFLTVDRYINVPLEETYERAWAGMPSFWRDVIVG